MVSVFMLFNELLLDIVALVTGIVGYQRMSGGKLQRAWFILAISLSVLLLYENIEWIYMYRAELGRNMAKVELPLDHLSLWYILKSILFFQVFSLFPIATSKPGWLTLPGIILLCMPVVLISCIALCYDGFNSHYTILRSFSDIMNNLGNQDVMLRLGLFVASVIAPIINFLYPFLKGWVSFRGKYRGLMLFYVFSFSLIMVGYCLLMLAPSSLIFNLFGYVIILPVIYMNILHLLGKRPFGNTVEADDEVYDEAYEEKSIYTSEPSFMFELRDQLHEFMQTEKPFVDPKYSLQDVLEALETNENRLNKVLRKEGFSGFRDYINHHRLYYFKEQAALNKDLTVKELMYNSGFTSRSSFYRYFASVEDMSPTEYLDSLRESTVERE